jgi:hypothetical protein
MRRWGWLVAVVLACGLAAWLVLGPSPSGYACIWHHVHGITCGSKVFP